LILILVLINLFSFVTNFIILLSVAFLVLMERKILGLSQIRVRPNVSGYFRILQTIFDRVKLLTKFSNLNSTFIYLIYNFMPGLFILFSILSWRVLNFNFKFSIRFLILILLRLFSLYPILWSG
jgi:NADH:ubiquinone oxidoreductase subunit H